MNKKVKKIIALFLVVTMLLLTSISVSGAALQIYTRNVTHSGATALGSLYGYRISTNHSWIRLARATTFVSGVNGGLGRLMVFADLYTTGQPAGGAMDGFMPGSISAQTPQRVMEASHNVTSISSAHTVMTAFGTFPNIPGLSMRVGDIR